MKGVGPGTVLGGRYTVYRRVAEDRGTERWTADDTTLGRQVALTVVALDDHRSAAFLDAARRAASVSHAVLVRILDVGQDHGVAYVVEEVLDDAKTLGRLVTDGGIPGDEVRRITGEVASALESARQRGMHHLDLTPDDVLRTTDGEIRLRGLEIAGVRAGEDGLEPEESARRDAVGVVALAYAGLTGLWPLGAGASGLGAAPRVPAGVASPSEIAAGVPRDIDAICRLTLNDDQGPTTPGDYARQVAPWSSRQVIGKPVVPAVLAGSASASDDGTGSDAVGTDPATAATDGPATAALPAVGSAAPADATGEASTEALPARPATSPLPALDEPTAASASAGSAATAAVAGATVAGAAAVTGGAAVAGAASASSSPSPTEDDLGATAAMPRITAPADDVRDGADTAAVSDVPAVGAGPADVDEEPFVLEEEPPSRPAPPAWLTAGGGDPFHGPGAGPAEGASDAAPGSGDASGPAGAGAAAGIAAAAAGAGAAAGRMASRASSWFAARTRPEDDGDAPQHDAAADGLSPAARTDRSTGEQDDTTWADEQPAASGWSDPAWSPRWDEEPRSERDGAPAAARDDDEDTAAAAGVVGVVGTRVSGLARRAVDKVSELSPDTRPAHDFDDEAPAAMVPAEPLTRDESKLALGIVVAFLVFALVIGIYGVKQIGSRTDLGLDGSLTGSSTTSASASPSASASASASASEGAPAAPEPLAILKVEALDPEGDGAENNNLTPKTYDGDTSTGWNSENYATDDFGGLKKGLGLVVDLGPNVKPQEIRLDFPKPVDFEVWVGPDASLDGAKKIGEKTNVDGEQTFAVPENVSGQYIIVWYTGLHVDGDGKRRAWLDEVVVTG